MKLSEFNFKLPANRTAVRPTKDRDGSKLMVINKDSGKINHKKFTDLVSYFEEGDVIVLNDTKVFPARLYGQKEKTGAKIEVFLLRELNPELNLWDVLVDPARKIRVGNKLYFGNGELVAEVIDNTTSRGRTIRFIPEDSEKDFHEIIKEYGETPLPKIIKRKIEKDDKERFQTIYAKKTGAVAAPAAGLHFTKIILKKLELIGVKIVTCLLYTSPSPRDRG